MKNPSLTVSRRPGRRRRRGLDRRLRARFFFCFALSAAAVPSVGALLASAFLLTLRSNDLRPLRTLSATTAIVPGRGRKRTSRTTTALAAPVNRKAALAEDDAGGEADKIVAVVCAHDGDAGAGGEAVSEALRLCWGRQEPLLIRGALGSATSVGATNNNHLDASETSSFSSAATAPKLDGDREPPKTHLPLPTLAQLVQWVVDRNEDDDEGDSSDGDGPADTAGAWVRRSGSGFPVESARMVRRRFNEVAFADGDEGKDPLYSRDLESMTLQWGPFATNDLQWMHQSTETETTTLANDEDAAQISGGVVGTTRVEEEGGRVEPNIASSLPARRSFGPVSNRRRERRISNKLSVAATSIVAHTLLLNDVDRHLPALADWLDDEFTQTILGDRQSTATGTSSPLLPRWRRDDAQLSLSSKGGGVGPHVDSYDVFLVQVSGIKRWTLSQRTMSVHEERDRTIPDLDMRVLDLGRRKRTNSDEANGVVDLVAMREPVVVRPGDVLYIPPRFVHDGVALTDHCQTLSVGCRAPSSSELLSRFADALLSLGGGGGGGPTSNSVLEAGAARYTDDETWLRPSCDPGGDDDKTKHRTRDSATLSPQAKDKMKHMVRNALEAFLDDDCLWDELVGRLVTESPRGSDLASLASSEEEETCFGATPHGDGATDWVWQRRPGVSLATSQPVAGRVRMFCHGEMWEADVPDPLDRDRVLSLLHQVERGERIQASAIDELSCPASTELWSCLVEDGVLVCVA